MREKSNPLGERLPLFTGSDLFRRSLVESAGRVEESVDDLAEQDPGFLRRYRQDAR